MKHIVKSAFFITVGGALPLLASVVLLIPYTDNLHTADYGALAIYISFALLVQILMNYGVDSYLSVHYYDHHEDPKALKSFLAGITGGLLVYGIALTIVLSLVSWLLFPLIFPDGSISFWPYGFMSILTGFFNAWFRMYVNIQVFADKARKYFWFGLFNFIVTIAISAFLVYKYPFSLVGPMWGRLLSGVLIFLLTFGFGLKEFGIRLVYKTGRLLREYSTPIVIFSLLTWVLGYINNYILNAFSTTADVGVYDFALKCTLVIEYAGLGLTGAINPRIFQLWKKNGNTESTQEENRYYHAFSAVNVIIISFNILIIPIIIQAFISNESYYESIKYIPLLCVAFTFKGIYSMYVNPVFYFKKTTILPLVLSITALVQIISGAILINFFGIRGAVWSFFLVRPIQIVILWVAVRRIYNFKFNKFKLVVAPILFSTMVIALYYFVQLPFQINGAIQFGLAILIIGVVYRKELLTIPNLVFNKNQK